MAVFFDTHAHLDDPGFAPDFAQVIARAQAAGIVNSIAIGTDFASSARAIKLAEEHSGIHAVVGWHPSQVLEAPADIRPALRELARHPKVVALGETGLDYYRLPSTRGGTSADDETYRRRQAGLFQQHLEVAAETGLNCVIHQRGNCFAETLALLHPFADRVRGVFHCFANDAAAMQRVIALGSLVSFTGMVTFKNGQNVRATVASTPLGKFLLETDCPYLAPMPYRGKRCEPAHVKEISETIARVKGCSLEELSHATCVAALGFFPKMSVPSAA
jgi:TatD DNase family protein